MQFSNILDLLGPASQIVLGIFVGLVLNLVVQWKSTYNSKMNLRRALIAELDTIYIKLERIPDNKTEIGDLLEDLPRTVYESNASRIGGLSKKEVRAVTTFYSVSSGYQLYNLHRSLDEEIAENLVQIEEILKNVPDQEDIKNTRRSLLSEYEEILERRKKDEAERRLNRLKSHRKDAVDSLNSNLEDSIWIYVWKEIIHMKFRIRSLINRLRTPNSWEDIPENQCVTLVAIAYLYGNMPFSHNDFQEKSKSRDIGAKFERKVTVDTRERTLVALRLRNLLERVEGEYQINTREGGEILREYYDQLDEKTKKHIDISWA